MAVEWFLGLLLLDNLGLSLEKTVYHFCVLIADFHDFELLKTFVLMDDPFVLPN